MKIVFFGTPKIAADLLEDLLQVGYDIALVVTKPDKPKGRTDKLMPPEVKLVALEHSLNLMQPLKVSTPEWIEKIASVKPDLFVVVAYGEILSQALLDVPKFGSINLHSSLLPKFRGAAPIQRALIEGEKETGVSIIRLVKKMDAGPVLCVKKIPITDEMRSLELYNALTLLGKEALIETIEALREGVAKEVIQDESLVTYAAKLELEDCGLDFSKTAIELHNLSRGAYPNPGAWFTLEVRGVPKRIKVVRSFVKEDCAAKPFEIVNSKKDFIIGTGHCGFQILVLKEEGKAEMSAGDWLRGTYGQIKLIY